MRLQGAAEHGAVCNSHKDYLRIWHGDIWLCHYYSLHARPSNACILCFIVAEFASANHLDPILVCHLANDLIASKSRAEKCEMALPIAFASVMKYSVERTDAEMILSPDSFESVRHMLPET